MADIQAIIFDKRLPFEWTPDTARAWLQKHGYEPIKRVHATKNFYRYRIQEVAPEGAGHYATRELPNGIQLIMMFEL